MGERKRITAKVRARVRIGLAILYLIAGALHLILPEPFVAIMPPWVPFPELVVALTGLAEAAGAAGLMTPGLRYAAGVGLALYAVCVFPANIQHALASLDSPDALAGWWYHGPRLLLQPVIVWLALWAGEVVDWPFGRKP